jgi:hypothetical protein
VVGEGWNTQILVNLPVTEVPRGTRNKAKTLGLKHLKPPDMSASCGSPDWARVVHQGSNKLLVEQHSVPDGEFTPRVKDRTQQAHPLGSSSPDLLDVRRPGESFI